MSSASSTLLSSRKVRSSLAVAEPLSITARRSSSEPARVPLKSLRFRAKVRIALAEATWPLRTVLLSLIRAVVTSKLSLAASMNDVPLSMIRWRSSPVPPNAAPISVTVVCRASLSTDSTVFEMSVSRVWVAIGVLVSSGAISESSRR